VAETICVHSDTPGALAVAKAVHAVLKEYLPRAASTASATGIGAP
jgi:lactam utilization protein B